LGVVALITPWNHPLLITIKKLAPALAAGNSVIIKPSEKAPLSVQYLVSNILAKAGLPLGTVQVLLGNGDTATNIIQNDKIQRIDFTGGTQAGRNVTRIAGERLIPITAELGGKTAVLICDDCDIDQVVEGVLTAGFIASGQTCITGSRIIIHTSIYDVFVQKLVERTGQLKVGLPWEEGTQIGPLIDSAALDRCDKFMEQTRKDGSSCLVGGSRINNINKDGRVIVSAKRLMIGLLLLANDP
jgi:acyl-CoA reductase-like NAD-dependent aldehyde dehydrogenase